MRTTNMDRKEIKAIADGIETHSDGLALFHELVSKFGWSGTVFQPDDLRDYVANCRDADNLPELSDDELEEWVNNLTSSWQWRKGLIDGLAEVGWEIIEIAYEELLADKRK
jgi:hypothetical protein